MAHITSSLTDERIDSVREMLSKVIVDEDGNDTIEACCDGCDELTTCTIVDLEPLCPACI